MANALRTYERNAFGCYMKTQSDWIYYVILLKVSHVPTQHLDIDVNNMFVGQEWNLIALITEHHRTHRHRKHYLSYMYNSINFNSHWLQYNILNNITLLSICKSCIISFIILFIQFMHESLFILIIIIMKLQPYYKVLISRKELIFRYRASVYALMAYYIIM